MATATAGPLVVKRAISFDWNSVVSDANALWPAVEPGMELQMIRTVLETQLPPLQNTVRLVILDVIAAGEQIANMGLNSASIGAVAAVLYFIALNYKYCINIDGHTFTIPTEAISNGAELGSALVSLSSTTSNCPPNTAMPDCSK